MRSQETMSNPPVFRALSLLSTGDFGFKGYDEVALQISTDLYSLWRQASKGAQYRASPAGAHEVAGLEQFCFRLSLSDPRHVSFDGVFSGLVFGTHDAPLPSASSVLRKNLSPDELRVQLQELPAVQQAYAWRGFRFR